MKFFLDECILGKTKTFLKNQGYTAISVSDIGKTSAPDEEILELAKNQNASLITSDLDFSNIKQYPLMSHCGIIILRMRASDGPGTIDQLHLLLSHLLKKMTFSEIKGTLIVIDRNKYRIHRKK